MVFQDVVAFLDIPWLIYDELGLTEFPWPNLRHSTEWLAGVNATRTWVHGRLEFMPHCAVNKESRYEMDLPMCAAWYRLLIGALRLREDPIFTMHVLEYCLFALSGSIFLIIIRWVKAKIKSERRQ